MFNGVKLHIKSCIGVVSFVGFKKIITYVHLQLTKGREMFLFAQSRKRTYYQEIYQKREESPTSLLFLVASGTLQCCQLHNNQEEIPKLQPVQMDPHPTMQQKSASSNQQENRSSCRNLLNNRRLTKEVATKKILLPREGLKCRSRLCKAKKLNVRPIHSMPRYQQRNAARV